MAKPKQPEIAYCGREELDAELDSAIRDIRSAEEEAKRVIDGAELAIKEMRLRYSVEERELREASGRELAEARDTALREATDRATRDCAEKMREAERGGAKLVDGKRALIDKCIAKLYSELGGK
ncbi:MAG: hypothetical protein OSJ83_01255 [Clostridia bacterium]|nr:hypothetical protein [Clostridia bacterium]